MVDRAVLKVRDLRSKVTEPNLRFPAVFCETLCGFLRRRICGNVRFSAKICVLGSLCHLSSVPLSAPRTMVEPGPSRQKAQEIYEISALWQSGS